MPILGVFNNKRNMLSFSFFFSCSLLNMIWEKLHGVEAIGTILMAMSSKAEKLLTKSSSAKELTLLNPNNNGSISFKLPAPSHTRRSTKSFDLDNGVDTFFDCEEWSGPASVSEDVSYNFTTPCWSSYESESAGIGMGSPPKNIALHTKEPSCDSNSEEKNLPHFFFQDQFWNHEYKHVDHHHRHRNKVLTMEDNTKLVQFLEDSYWVHQADAGAGAHQKSKSFPCIPRVAGRKSKGKPPSAVSVSVSVSTQNYVPRKDNSKPRKTNMAKTSRCCNCLPISFSWLRFKGRKRLSPAPIQD